MPEPGPVSDLVTAVADALRGDRTGLQAIVAGARERAQDRALDSIVPGARDRITSGPVAAPATYPVQQAASDRSVQIRLPNGRRMRAMISPGVAGRRDLSAVARVSAENDRRAFAALERQRSAINALGRSQEALARKVAALRSQSDGTLIGLAQGFTRPGRRAGGAATPLPATLVGTASRRPSPAFPSRGPGRSQQQQSQRLQQLRQAEQARTLATRTQIQNVTNVVHSVQAAAYGEKGRLLAPNNLLLAGNQLFWTLLDPVLQRAGVLDAKSATVMAALAPLGSLVTGGILLGDRQTVRFISGTAELTNTRREVRISLRDEIGERRWPAFRRRTDVPVNLTVLGDDQGALFLLQTEVNQGSLRIFVEDDLSVVMGKDIPLRVAWMVDTGAEGG